MQLLEIVCELRSFSETAVRAARRMLAEWDFADVDGGRAGDHFMAAAGADAGSVFDEQEPGYDPKHIGIMRMLILLGYVYYSVVLLVLWIRPMFQWVLIQPTPGMMGWLGFAVLVLVYYLVAGALLYLRKALGWYLSMIIAVNDIVTRVCVLLLSLLTGFDELGMATPLQLLSLFVTGVILLLLWTPAMRDAYGISCKSMRRTAGWSTLAGVLLILVRELYQ